MVASVAAAAALAQTQAPLPSYRSSVPITVDGETVRLDMRIYKPDGSGPFPTLVFNHGSTGYGTDSARIKQAVDAPAVAAFFVRRGWAVVMPARRGRAESEGLYDEGFSFIRALGYSCIPSLSLSGADRALRDIEAGHDGHPHHAIRRQGACRHGRHLTRRRAQRGLRRHAPHRSQGSRQLRGRMVG
ncbi:MAG: hypothetical protein IPO43_14670 [Rhodoferax sp.]|nr:hypothetical protein [Rhodoferax sp.]